MISRGRNLALFRSKMTSAGCFSRMRGNAMSGERSKNTGAASAFAAVEILMEKIRSSTRHSTIVQANHDGHDGDECSFQRNRVRRVGVVRH
jgi:hypothetical protein